jgi:Neurotransmitter-gated ion-channel transmembrane region
LIQTFAPSSLVVMLSWFSFWLGLDAIPGRVTLLVTCMLTLVTMFTGADIPPVAYVKVDKYSIRMTLKYSTKNIAGTRFVDGGLHGVCFCSASRICCCQSIGCSISTAIESNENDFAVAIDEHNGKGTMSSSRNV